ncbi:COG5510 Predicted small secreted protein [Methylophilaceae bacterium]|jgi:entericidin B
MKSLVKFSALLLVVCFALSACNTVRGVGKDIEKGGEAIQKSTN